MTSETVADVLAEMRNSGWPSNAENWAERIDRALRGAEAVAWQYLGSSSLVGRFPHPEWRICDDHEAAAAAGFEVRPLYAAPPAPAASVPDGYVLAPHFRGFAHLGLGRYRLFHSRPGVDAELFIVPATPDETAGRVVGDLRDDGPDEIPAELMAVRLRFENAAGLDALEQQLRLLRETHFPAPPTNQEGAAPC